MPGESSKGNLKRLQLQISALTPLRIMLMKQQQQNCEEEDLFSNFFEPSSSLVPWNPLEKLLLKIVQEDFAWTQTGPEQILAALRQVSYNAKNLDEAG